MQLIAKFDHHELKLSPAEGNYMIGPIFVTLIRIALLFLCTLYPLWVWMLFWIVLKLFNDFHSLHIPHLFNHDLLLYLVFPPLYFFLLSFFVLWPFSLQSRITKPIQLLLMPYYAFLISCNTLQHLPYTHFFHLLKKLC